MSDVRTTVWAAIRDRVERLEPGAALVTPISDRPFRIELADEERILIRFQDSGEERRLWREQFEVLADRLSDGALGVDDLPPGVEPYVGVVSLLGEFTVENDAIAHAPDGQTDEGSPFLVSPAEARTRPERLHDDALLLADLLDRLDPADLASLETGSLTDLYVMLSDVQHESDRLRQSARDALLDRLGPNQELHGRFGTVRRTTRERRHPKDDEMVLDALDERGIPREWVLGVDPDKLDVVLAATDLTEAAVLDVDENVYVQKTGVDEPEKVSRLQGLADRIDELEGPEGEALRAELADLEAQLDEALSA